MANVFVCHSSKDADAVQERVVDPIRSLGHEVWYSPSDLVVTDGLNEQIHAAIAKSDVFVAALSPAALQSPWVRGECKTARNLGTRIVVLLIEACDYGSLDVRLNETLALDTNVEADRQTLRREAARWFPGVRGEDLAHDLERLQSVTGADSEADVGTVLTALVSPYDYTRDQARRILREFDVDEVVSNLPSRLLEGPSASELLQAVAELPDAARWTGLTEHIGHVAPHARQEAGTVGRQLRHRAEFNALGDALIRARIPYRLLGPPIGHGLYTTTYPVLDRSVDRRRVLRLLRTQVAETDPLRARVLDLWKQASDVVHENLTVTRTIIQLPASGVYACVRDYVSGKPLSKMLADSTGLAQAFNIASNLASSTARALTYLQQLGIAHGAIHPANVIVSDDGRVSLTDVGIPISDFSPGEPIARSRAAYAAPETFYGKGGLPADVYSLGCLLLHILTGEYPIAGDNLYEIHLKHSKAVPRESVLDSTKLSSGLKSVLSSMLDSRPEARPDALQALHEPIAEFVRDSKAADDPAVVPTAIEDALYDLLDTDHDPKKALQELARRFPEEQAAIETLAKPLDRDVDAESGDNDAVEGFDLQEQVGRGSQGVVYRAIHTATGREVALKILHEFGKYPIDDFQREMKAMRLLDHPYIGRVLDSGLTAGGQPYIVMEFIDGEPVTMWASQRRLSTRDRLVLTSQICEAVAHAHERRLVHCDLKPSNILVRRSGNPCVVDFGLALRVGDDREYVGGTPGFMSPEQESRQWTAVGPTADVFSLGVIAWELLSGQRPRPGEPQILTILPADVGAPDASPLDLQSLCEELLRFWLDQEPENRPADAGECLIGLRALLDTTR
ncbi:MAG: protein kinase [Planctomycetota bacterium]